MATTTFKDAASLWARVNELRTESPDLRVSVSRSKLPVGGYKGQAQAGTECIREIFKDGALISLSVRMKIDIGGCMYDFRFAEGSQPKGTIYVQSSDASFLPEGEDESKRIYYQVIEQCSKDIYDALNAPKASAV